MNNTFQLAFVILPVVPFITALILYLAMFKVDSFQGKAMVFLLIATSTILTLSAIAGLSFVIFGELAPWWSLVSAGSYLLLTIAGVVLDISIIRARKKVR